MLKPSPTLLVLMLLLGPAATFAAGGGGSTSSTGSGSSSRVAVDPVVSAARAAIAKEDWSGAQAELLQALAAHPDRADYHNLYAYSVRKGPNPDMDLVFRHYEEALRLNPRHVGAHEYIGEAYLQVNNLPKAREHLAALDKICLFSCEEYRDLKKAVAAYEASHKSAALR